MGKISRSDERSKKTDVLLGYSADHSFQRLFLHLCNLLIISTIFSLSTYQIANTQISNELAFDSIVIGYCHENADTLSKVTGFLTEGVEGKLKNRLKGTDSLTIEEPRVKFKKVGDHMIERSIEVDLIVNAETGEMKNLVYRDTLDPKSLRAVRATKYPELKGEHPSAMRRFVWPSIGLVGGVGTIISLFYIRSR